jgi:hypothetical protein
MFFKPSVKGTANMAYVLQWTIYILELINPTIIIWILLSHLMSYTISNGIGCVEGYFDICILEKFSDGLTYFPEFLKVVCLCEWLMI